MRPALLGAALLVLLATGAGCQNRPGAQGSSTTTGLPYRPPGDPTYVELTPSFRVFPSPQPASN